MSEGDLPVYLINLDRATERLARVTARLRAAGLDRVTRISAVDGRQLSWGQRLRLSSSLRFFMANARRLMPSELGCALSHGRVYAAMAAAGDGLALVFEDDVVLDVSALRAALVRICAAAAETSAPSVWLLNDTPAFTRGRDFAPGIHATARAFFACSYVINRAGAALLARENAPVCALADAWGRWALCGLRVYWVTPFACQTDAPESQIGWAVPVRARWGWYRALWSVRHALGSALDRWLLRLRRRIRRGKPHPAGTFAETGLDKGA